MAMAEGTLNGCLLLLPATEPGCLNVESGRIIAAVRTSGKTAFGGLTIRIESGHDSAIELRGVST